MQHDVIKNVNPLLVCEIFRQLYGEGIYSTPYPFIAENFATEFIYAGKTFKLLMQNRVDMSRTTLENNNKYYVTQDDRYIRPYGLLFKEVFEEMYWKISQGFGYYL